MTDDEDYTIREADDDVLTRPAEDPAEKEREEAFNAGYAWKGVTFEGFACCTKDVWRSFCHKAGFASLSACDDDPTLFVPHARAAVWICQLEPKALRRLRSLGHSDMLHAFEAWVGENCKMTDNDEYDIWKLGKRIYDDSCKNTAEAVASGSPGK